MKIGWPHPRGRAGHRVIGIWTICVSLLQPQHRGQKLKSVFTTNNCLDSHVIWSPDSDRDSVMIVIVMSLSVSDHFPDVPISSQTLGHKPDTNTKGVTPLWWVSEVGQGQLYTDGDITLEKKALGSCPCFIQWEWVGQMTRVMDQIPQTHFWDYHQQYILIGIWLWTSPHKDFFISKIGNISEHLLIFLFHSFLVSFMLYWGDNDKFSW